MDCSVEKQTQRSTIHQMLALNIATGPICKLFFIHMISTMTKENEGEFQCIKQDKNTFISKQSENP